MSSRFSRKEIYQSGSSSSVLSRSSSIISGRSHPWDSRVNNGGAATTRKTGTVTLPIRMMDL